MNAQNEGVTQLSPCHISHRGLLSDSLFPFVRGKFLPSWLRHTTTPCAHPKSISGPAKGFILSRCLVGSLSFPWTQTLTPIYPWDGDCSARMAQRGPKPPQKALQELILWQDHCFMSWGSISMNTLREVLPHPYRAQIHKYLPLESYFLVISGRVGKIGGNLIRTIC